MRVRKSTLVWVAAASLLLGLWVSQYVIDVSPILYIGCVGIVPLTKRGTIVSLVIISVCFVSLGLLRSEAWASSSSFVNQKVGSQVVVRGLVVTDTVFDDRRQLEFEIDDVVLIDDGQLINISGRMRIRGFGAPMVMRKDTVEITGKLQRGFGARVASMSFAHIEVTGRSTSQLEAFRRSFSARLFSGLSDEEASLALGILVGQRSSISEQNENNLRAVGLTHIIAVSGYNLSVLVRLARRRLGGLSKFQSTLMSILLVVLFVSIAGYSASIIRATWVIGLSLLAWYFGRSIRPIVLLMLSAAATAWFNPFYLWYDIGWWLSFAAFFGVLMIGPQLQQRIYAGKKPHFVMQLAIESFAASLMTAPLIMWIFERVSIVSLLANILVVPVIPLIMILSFIAGMMALVYSDFLITKLAFVLTSITLSYVLFISDKLAAIPFAEVKIGFSTTQMLLTYAIILVATFVLHKKTKLSEPYNLLE